jgi:CBS domain-containing protein
MHRLNMLGRVRPGYRRGGSKQGTAHVLQAAASESVTVSADDSLHRAAQLMSAHGVSHAIVVDAASGYPAGVLSRFDLAAAYATA